MSRQFEQVNTTYGAPMGRRDSGHLDTAEPKNIRLFKVNLDNGGYDDGGAYWGHGLQPLFCAIDSLGNRCFVRAASREHAALILGIPNSALKRRLYKNGLDYGFAVIDGRAPMPSGLDRQDVIEWLKSCSAKMGQQNNVLGG